MTIQQKAKAAFLESVSRSEALDPATLLLCLSAELCRNAGFSRPLTSLDDIMGLSEAQATAFLDALPVFDLSGTSLPDA